MATLEGILQDSGAYSSSKAQAHLTTLRLFCSVYDVLGRQNSLTSFLLEGVFTPEQSEAQLNYFLTLIEWRYMLYLRLLVSLKDRTPKERWPLPPWDVALFLHTHLLSPVQFARDMENPAYQGLRGVLDFPLLRFADQFRRTNGIGDPTDVQWHSTYPNTPYSLVVPRTRRQEVPTFPPELGVVRSYMPKFFMSKFQAGRWFGMDLIAAVKRQISFARKITALYPYDPVPSALLLDSQRRYGKFMNLIRLSAVAAPVPALDIDLFWHTHQLSSSNYLPWCRHHVGHEINHDDNVENGELVSGLDETMQAWRNLYNEDYLNPSPGLTFQNAQNVPHEPSTLDKMPPPNLTPAQRALWDFDVDCQVRHEAMDFRLRKLREKLAVSTERLAAAQSSNAIPLQPLPLPPPQHLSGGFMTRLLRAAVADDRPPPPPPRHPLETARICDLDAISELHTLHNTCREGWGRTRWPILVAARGWGDPTVTRAKYPRQPQGTMTVDFPLYPATFYDRRPLGSHDYVFGNRNGDGATYGGGAPLGGGMCAGKFDGGNCVADRYVFQQLDGSGGC